MFVDPISGPAIIPDDFPPNFVISIIIVCSVLWLDERKDPPPLQGEASFKQPHLR
jgi:hypothetical protein